MSDPANLRPGTPEIVALVDCAIARDAIRTLDVPHVVHVYDRVLRLPIVLGPFPGPVSASVFAERYVADATGLADDRASLRADVIPLERVALTRSDRRWIRRTWKRQAV